MRALKFKRFKTLLVAFGDLAILYGSLALTLLIRYGSAGFEASWQTHFESFSLIFVLWLVVFYLSDLYSDKFFKHTLETAQTFVLAIIINFGFSIGAFYAFGTFFQLTPKTNLLIFALVFGVFDYLWRLALAKFFISGGWRKQILIIGDSPNIADLISYLKQNPQTGYDVNLQLKELGEEKFGDLVSIIKNNKIEMIVTETHLKKDSETANLIYRLLPLEIQIVDFADFYETIFQKVPLEELEESWFIESITTGRRFYDSAKRIIDAILALMISLIFLPLMALIGLVVKITSEGPIIYKQERIGKNNKPFILYKFRTMKIDAEKNGAQWATKNDSRITPIGHFLRKTHLDELPQLLNILKGNLSFVGARPERPEFIKELKEKIPYYEIRHLIKPGFTGWAQINYRYGASVEDAVEKLQYEIYYLKNRSLILDLLIILKTIRLFFKGVE